MDLKVVWTQMLWDIIHHGHTKTKDDSEIIEHINNHYFIDTPYSVMLQKRMNSDFFVDLLSKGAFDIENYLISGEALTDYVLSLLNDNMIYFSNFARDDIKDTDSFVYTYPERLLSCATIDSIAEDGKIYFENQVDIIVGRLKENLYSNRAVATLYIPGIDGYREDIPCLNWLQALVKDDCLTLHIMFRSNDIYQAFPANMTFLMFLGVKIVDELKESYPTLYFGGIYYNSTSAHIYKTNEEQVLKLLGENK